MPLNNQYDEVGLYAWSLVGGRFAPDGSIVNIDQGGIQLGGTATGGDPGDGSATLLNNNVAFIAATADASRPIVFGNDGSGTLDTQAIKFGSAITNTTGTGEALFLNGAAGFVNRDADNTYPVTFGTGGTVSLAGANFTVDSSGNALANILTAGAVNSGEYAFLGSSASILSSTTGVVVTDGLGQVLSWDSDNGGLLTNGIDVVLGGGGIRGLSFITDPSSVLSLDNANRLLYAGDGATVQMNFSAAASGVVFSGNASITSFGGVSPAQIATTSLPDPTTNEAATVFDDTANLLSFSDGVNWQQVLVAGGSGASLTNLPRQVYSGSFSGTGTATTSFVVTIGTTQAGTSYEVNVTPTSALSAAVFYISAKTTTTFTVTYLAGLTGTVTFDWSVFP